MVCGGVPDHAVRVIAVKVGPVVGVGVSYRVESDTGDPEPFLCDLSRVSEGRGLDLDHSVLVAAGCKRIPGHHWLHLSSSIRAFMAASMSSS